MFAERRHNCAYQLRHKQYQYRFNRANGLDQETSERQPDGFATERNQAEDAIRPALQMAGNDRQAIAKMPGSVLHVPGNARKS